MIKGSCETTHAVVPKYHEKQYNRSGNTVLNAYPRGYALKAAFPGISGETIDKVEQSKVKKSREYIILSDFAIAGAKAVAIVPVRCYHKSTTTNTGQEDNSYG